MLFFFDFAKPYQLGFQNPATPIMEGIIDLHHQVFFYILVILIFVLWFFFRTLQHFYVMPSQLKYSINDLHVGKNNVYIRNVLDNDDRYIVIRKTEIFAHAIMLYLSKSARVTHHHFLEFVWTIIPSIILVSIALPSFALLYSLDEVIDPSITIKIVGHQWYWSYEYSDYFLKLEKALGADNAMIAFDSFMIPEDELSLGQLRLLEVSNCLVVPINTHIRVLITSVDVLHSWAVPSLGVKVDAVPGRLNQATLFLKREGIFYGQCSEICGVNHGFMPIVLKSTSFQNYLEWLVKKFTI